MSKPSAAAIKILERFEEAIRAHEMKGAERLEDHFAIEAEYDEAKKAIIELLK